MVSSSRKLRPSIRSPNTSKATANRRFVSSASENRVCEERDSDCEKPSRESAASREPNSSWRNKPSRKFKNDRSRATKDARVDRDAEAEPASAMVTAGGSVILAIDKFLEKMGIIDPDLEDCTSRSYLFDVVQCDSADNDDNHDQGSCGIVDDKENENSELKAHKDDREDAKKERKLPKNETGGSVSVTSKASESKSSLVRRLGRSLRIWRRRKSSKSVISKSDASKSSSGSKSFKKKLRVFFRVGASKSKSVSKEPPVEAIAIPRSNEDQSTPLAPLLPDFEAALQSIFRLFCADEISFFEVLPSRSSEDENVTKKNNTSEPDCELEKAFESTASFRKGSIDTKNSTSKKKPSIKRILRLTRSKSSREGGKQYDQVKADGDGVPKKPIQVKADHTQLPYAGRTAFSEPVDAFASFDANYSECGDFDTSNSIDEEGKGEEAFTLLPNSYVTFPPMNITIQKPNTRSNAGLVSEQREHTRGEIRNLESRYNSDDSRSIELRRGSRPDAPSTTQLSEEVQTFIQNSYPWLAEKHKLDGSSKRKSPNANDEVQEPPRDMPSDGKSVGFEEMKSMVKMFLDEAILPRSERDIIRAKARMDELERMWDAESDEFDTTDPQKNVDGQDLPQHCDNFEPSDESSSSGGSSDSYESSESDNDIEDGDCPEPMQIR